MKRTRFLSALLLLTMLLGTCTTACAASEASPGEDFTDVPVDAWYAEAVRYCKENGVMNGTSATTFSPKESLTRSALATVLYRIAGHPAISGAGSFADVPSGQWYSDAVSWAAQGKIMEGYGDGLFGVDDPVTHEQLAAILWRYEGSPAEDTEVGYSDARQIADWAVAAVRWAAASGVLDGMTDGGFAPKEYASRAEIAVILKNYLELDRGSGGQVLIVYYSWSENTKRIAERLSALIHADIYEIRTLKPYPKDGYETSDISLEERRTGNLPEIENDLPSLEGYDTVVVGGPIWNAYISTPLARYLELTDFSGKNVIPFSTSQGSGQGSYLSDFKARAKNPGKIGEYKDIRFPGNYSPDTFSDAEIDEMLSAWIKSNSLFVTQSSSHLAEDIMLNSGFSMPVLGLGTWTQNDTTAESSVYEAIKDGYRLFDTAQYYGNETGVGNGIRRAIREGLVKREEIFVTTKVMPGNYERAAQSIDESLDRLGLGYIDLMLVHQSGPHDSEVYQALCQGVKDGKIRSVGISNYYTPEEFDRVTAGAEVMPAVVQNENHIYYQNTALQAYVRQYGTVLESWYPFGGREHTQEQFSDPVIMEIAKAHGKTPAQVILRWHIQAGYIVIPGSSNPKHIAENYAVFDFELSPEEMQSIASLNANQRYENW